ncbi:MAG: leishmanolysin-related zinc metalloendopeptidase [Phycisphaerales bacterium]
MKNVTRTMCVSTVLVLAVAGATGAAKADFSINVNFVGGLTPSQQAIFTTAANNWESLVTGYRPGISITGINIDATGAVIDGAGGILGSAGPDAFANQGGFWLSTHGAMTFDSADLASMESNGTLLYVIMHEMGHVMGIGTLWNANGVYTTNSGHFTGAAALAAYQTEFNQPGATFVPVELGGGPGTANAHWDEATFGDELMTGWIGGPTYTSQMTLGSLYDIGFTVVPTPGALALAGVGLGAAARRRTR